MRKSPWRKCSLTKIWDKARNGPGNKGIAHSVGVGVSLGGPPSVTRKEVTQGHRLVQARRWTKSYSYTLNRPMTLLILLLVQSGATVKGSAGGSLRISFPFLLTLKFASIPLGPRRRNGGWGRYWLSPCVMTAHHYRRARGVGPQEAEVQG